MFCDNSDVLFRSGLRYLPGYTLRPTTSSKPAWITEAQVQLVGVPAYTPGIADAAHGSGFRGQNTNCEPKTDPMVMLVCMIRSLSLL